MKSLSIIAIFVVLSSNAYASIDLAKTKNCLSCHAVDRKLVGPSFNEVKNKYEKDSGAVDKLTQKLLKGGVGVWGPVPMPSNTQITAEEAKQLVKWILGEK